jgi:hypothetical protein
MPWFFEVAEAHHELQNPTSPEKVLLLGERMGLGPESHVLDVASGRAGPALVLAQAFGCRITCVEQSEVFHAAAIRRVREAGMQQRIQLIHSDAAEFPVEGGSFDAALCLGASFVWDGLPGTLSALAPAVRADGFVAVGEPYWRTWPLPEGCEPDAGEDYVSLPDTLERFEAAGLSPVTLIAASLDDWDRYETLHWLSVEAWLHEHPGDPNAHQIRLEDERSRDAYLRWQRDATGWAIIVGRKRT